MLIARYAKIVMSLSLAAFLLLVTFDNLTDYGSNFQFVRHVMSMDTTFPGSVLTYRAVTTPALWHLAYAIIIVSQGAAGILYLWGAVRLFQARHAPGAAFNQAKACVIAASLLGFVIFFFMFMVIGWEWFSMWQSKNYNAQEAALPLLHGGAWRADLRQPARRRPRPTSFTFSAPPRRCFVKDFHRDIRLFAKPFAYDDGTIVALSAPWTLH